MIWGWSIGTGFQALIHARNVLYQCSAPPGLPNWKSLGLIQKVPSATQRYLKHICCKCDAKEALWDLKVVLDFIPSVVVLWNLGQTERSVLIRCKSLNLGSSVAYLSVQETQKSNDLTVFPIWDLMSRKYLCDGYDQSSIDFKNRVQMESHIQRCRLNSWDPRNMEREYEA